VLALDLRRGPRFTCKPGDRCGIVKRLRQKELERNLLVELDMVRRDHDTHAADAEHALDAVFAGEDVTLPHSSR